jgi:predicted lipid-binding transport protein (Tim44 family)
VAQHSVQVSVDSTMEQISHLRTPQATREELEDIVQEFENEISDVDPDQSRVQELINKADEKSTDVAANLLMIAIQSGILKAAQLL